MAGFLPRLVVAALALSAPTVEQEPPPAPPSSAPSLRVEGFAPVRPYAVGGESVPLVATVRNTGGAPLPASAATGRLFAISGLDYGQGDTIPRIPALDPSAAATFRWSLNQNGARGPLVAAFALDQTGGAPDAELLTIHRFPDGVPGEDPGFPKTASARTARQVAVLENDKLRVRVARTESDVPALFLSSRTPTGWKRVGVSLPLAEIRSGEGTQSPWWELFRATEIRAINGKGEASLVLSGGFGLRWKATCTFTARTGSSAVDVRMQLSANREMRLYGFRFPTFLAGGGGFGAVVTEELPLTVTRDAYAGVRSGATTVGVVRSTDAPLRQLTVAVRPETPGVDYRLLGTEYTAPAEGVALPSTVTLTFRARLATLTPSAAASDLLKITLPRP